jgi:large conductance mechanosensitive channel
MEINLGYKPLILLTEEKKMSLLKEFKEFAVKGNVIDLAVAVIIGAAFGKIVSSLVADIIMPPIGVMMGGVNFADLVFVIQEAADSKAQVAIMYGKFIQTIVDFTVVAAAVFLFIKLLNNAKAKLEKEQAPAEPAAAPSLSKDQELLVEIRDLLKQKNS